VGLEKGREGLCDRLVERIVMFGRGSVMIWSYMTWESVGLAYKIDGKMNVNLYTSILENEFKKPLTIMTSLL